MNENEIRQLAVGVEGLGEAQQQLSVAVDQLRQLVNQLTTSHRELADKLATTEDLLSQVVPQVNRLPRLEEELRQTRDRATRLQDAVAEIAERVEQSDRLRQAEAERERDARLRLWDRLEPFEQEVTAIWARLNVADEVSRRLREQFAELQQQLATIEQGGAATDGRLTTMQEQVRRGEQDVSSLAGEMNVLRKQDETMTGRLQVLAEMLRHVDERSANTTLEERLHLAINERVEMVRSELMHLAGDTAELRGMLDEQGDGLDRQGRRLGQIEARLHTVNERFAETAADIQSYRQQIIEQVMGLAEAEEHQKRRQIDELERQIQDLRRRALGIAESSRA